MSQGKTPPRPHDGDPVLQALAEWPDAPKTALDWDDAAEQVSARMAAGAKPRSSLNLSDDDVLRAPLPQTKTEEESARDFSAKREPLARERDRNSLKELAKLANTPAPASASPVDVPQEDSGIVNIPILTGLAASMDREAPRPPPSRPARPVPAPAPSRPKPTLPRELMPVEAEPTKAEPILAIPLKKAGKKEARADEGRKGGGTWALFGVLAVAAAAAGVYLGVRGGTFKQIASTTPAPTSVASAGTPGAVQAGAPAPSTVTAGANGGNGGTPSIAVSSLAIADNAPRGASPFSGGPSGGGGGASGRGAPPLATNPGPPPVVADSKAAAAPSSTAAKPASTDLNSLMAQAVGASPAAAPTPAAQNTDSSQPAAGSVPLRPSLGAIQGALGAVVPGARGCLGPDDAVSHATVTFKSDGSVQSVAVTGGAAGTPAAACIRSALMKAHVPPFAQATSSSPVTIRPN